MAARATLSFPLQPIHEKLFREGSRTYYNSTKFFPSEMRKSVTLLYAFVRQADSLVDSIPQDKAGFVKFCQDFQVIRHAAEADELLLFSEDVDPVIAGFVYLERTVPFDRSWADAFLYSMELDLHKTIYETQEECLEYIYGSAEVIGLFMSRLMSLEAPAEHGARMLGRAMQYINFLRDIHEDNGLGRRYIPLHDVPFSDLQRESTSAHPQAFVDFFRSELRRFIQWQEEADSAFKYIPLMYRIPIRAASDMYVWTAQQIYADPDIIYRKQVKPSKARVIAAGIRAALRCGLAPRGRYLP